MGNAHLEDTQDADDHIRRKRLGTSGQFPTLLSSSVGCGGLQANCQLFISNAKLYF